MYNKTIINIFWSVLDRFLTSGIQMILNILIARILLPSDYGLIAMLGIFIMISQIFVDSGFSNALIQKKDRTDKDFATVFYFNIIVGGLVYWLLYIASPYIALFYSVSELEIILKISGVSLIINSLSLIHRVKLIIQLKFKLLTFISFVSVLLSGLVALWMAYNDYGVYTLVLQTLLCAILNTILLICFVKWFPLFVFSKKSFKNLFPFGSKLLVANLLSSLYTNIYTLVIGKKFAATELGYYNRAFSLGSYFSINITDTVMRVVYPVLCDIQHDNEQLKLDFIKYLRGICYIIFPLMIGIVCLAEPLVKVLLSDKWLPSVNFLQLLCIAYMWYPVIQLNMNLINVKGRSDYSLRAEFVKKILAIIILLLTLPLGIEIMCLGLVIASLCDLVIIIYYLNKILPLNLITQFRVIFPILLLSISMGVIIYIFSGFFASSFYKLIVGTLIGGSYYFFLSYVFAIGGLKDIFLFFKK